MIDNAPVVLQQVPVDTYLAVVVAGCRSWCSHTCLPRLQQIQKATTDLLMNLPLGGFEVIQCALGHGQPGYKRDGFAPLPTSLLVRQINDRGTDGRSPVLVFTKRA